MVRAWLAVGLLAAATETQSHCFAGIIGTHFCSCKAVSGQFVNFSTLLTQSTDNIRDASNCVSDLGFRVQVADAEPY